MLWYNLFSNHCVNLFKLVSQVSDVAYAHLVYLHCDTFIIFNEVLDLTPLAILFYSDPFLPEAIKYAEDKMQNVAVFSPKDTQPFLQEGIYVLSLHVFVI